MSRDCKIFYFLIWKDTPDDYRRKIKKAKKILCDKKNIKIIFCAAEEWEYTAEMKKFPLTSSKYLSKDIIIGHVKNNSMSLPKDFNIHLWKNSWLFITASIFDDNFLSTDYKNIDKLFISLNNKDHYWRCLMIDNLSKKNLLEKSYYSWRKDGGDRNNYSFKYWDEQVILLPSERKNFNNEQLDSIPQEFSKAVFHIVCESTVSDRLIDISEKTWKCILSAQPFIILGNPGVHQQLEDWGFKLYREIFAYDFDKIPEVKDRVESIVEQIANIDSQHSPEGYTTLKMKLQETANYNQQRAFQMIKNKEMIPQIVLDTDYYTQIIIDAEQNIGDII